MVVILVLCLADCHVIQMAVLSCTEVPNEMLVSYLRLPLASQVLDNVVALLQGGVFVSLHLHAVLGLEAWFCVPVDMLHCNGWCLPWGVAALAGTNVIIRSVDCKVIYDAKHKVTHFCGALVVLNTIANAGPHEKKPLPRRVDVLTGGSPPPPSVLSNMEEQGYNITHIYGLTETYIVQLLCAARNLSGISFLPLLKRSLKLDKV